MTFLTFQPHIAGFATIRSPTPTMPGVIDPQATARRYLIYGQSLHESLCYGCLNPPPGVQSPTFVYLAPTRAALEDAWKAIVVDVPRWAIAGISDRDKIIKFASGAVLFVASTDQAHLAVGMAIDGIALDIGDEASAHAWRTRLRPALATHGRIGWAFFYDGMRFDDQPKTAPATGVASHPVEAETAWLIESRLNGATSWWAGFRDPNRSMWRTAIDAVRFARKEDAEEVIPGIFNPSADRVLLATEHMFGSMGSPSA